MAAASWRTANLLWRAGDLLVKRHDADVALVAARPFADSACEYARAGTVDK
jgi:hypothetical protein